MYEKFIKRALDFIFALAALAILSPVLLILTVLGSFLMKGNPFFVQIRPGKDEKLFRMLKFRSMTNEKDPSGVLLPDEKRLTRYGRFLRRTSADELPQLLNILLGQMSFVGPRPQLVADMLFMTPQQRRRHRVMPGLTGLAQAKCRHSGSWQEKLHYDGIYADTLSFRTDAKILLETVRSLLESHESVLLPDLGDDLLKKGLISRTEYEKNKIAASELLEVANGKRQRMAL